MAVIVPVPTPTVPEPVVVAPAPEPTFAPLPPLAELRIRNQTQETDQVSKVVVAFALEPVDELVAEVALLPAERPAAPQKFSPIDEVAPDTYELTAQVGIGPVRGSFKGKVAMSDREPESRYTLHAEGSGRPGSATGEARIELTDDGEGTHLTFDADVTIRGAIGRVGGRLLTSSARGMARQFFEAIERDAKAAAQEGAAT